MTSIITKGEIKAGDIYHGFCCAGFDYEITLVNPEYPLESLWGCCHNPACPVAVEYDRGVSWWMIEDFAAKVAEGKTNALVDVTPGLC